MIDLNRITAEVFVARNSVVSFGDEETAFVKKQALLSPRKRARICAHPTDDDLLHEMLIAISFQSYIHPHRHFGKSESFHLVEGRADVVVMDDDGEISQVVHLGAGLNFFYRSSEPLFHTLLIHSNMLVVHEVTNGPFNNSQAEVAFFAPPESDEDAARDYMAELAARVERFKVRR